MASTRPYWSENGNWERLCISAPSSGSKARIYRNTKFRSEFGTGLNGVLHFCDDSHFEPELSESRMLAQVHGMAYGMCIDLVGTMYGERSLIELKCGAAASPAWQLQTAGYDLGKHGRATLPRYGLQVGPQFARNYKLLPHEDPLDYDIWVSVALAGTIWKMNHNYKLEFIPEREAA